MGEAGSMVGLWSVWLLVGTLDEGRVRAGPNYFQEARKQQGAASPGVAKRVRERLAVTPRALLGVAERVRKQLGGDVDDRDHALVGHAGRADDAERADDPAVHFVRGGDHAH